MFVLYEIFFTWGACVASTRTSAVSSEGSCATAEAALRVRKRTMYAVTFSSFDQKDLTMLNISEGAVPRKAPHVCCRVMGPSCRTKCGHIS